MILRPFWRYFGAKWRIANRYPAPRRSLIIEPFAGAAGYSLHYPERDVLLIDCYPVVAGIWRWLIQASTDEVRSIPLVDSIDDLPNWVQAGARDLIGFAMNAATVSPRRRLSSGCRRLRDTGRVFYGWTDQLRERVATQVPKIRHWKILEASYLASPIVDATWFVDSPYEGRAGGNYVHGSSRINYSALAGWCRSLPGQAIVCEAEGAEWLPFRPLGCFKSGPISRFSSEAIWTS